MHPRWQQLLAAERALLTELEQKLAHQQYLPAAENVMRAFETDPQQTKVVIIGQDPYPTEGVAVGLAFATARGARPIPGSLRNILKELQTDIGPATNLDETLQLWLDQGVMLLNRHLTCSIGQAGSHQKIGWSKITDAALEKLQKLHGSKLVVLLWGNQAQELLPKLQAASVLRGVHPSPLSANRGFFGSKPFSNINRILSEHGCEPIDWIGENVAFRF